MRHIRFQGFVTGTVLLAASIIVAGDQTPAPLPLDQLTVPNARLPKGCRLSPLESESERADRVRRTVWPIGLPTNPWQGTDRRSLATIRGWIGPSAPAGASVPDGPPLSARELHSFQMRLADSVEEGYAAMYNAEGDTGFVTIMGIRLTSDPAPLIPPARRRANEPWRFTSGRTIVTVSGEGSPCFAVIAAHVGSLFTR